MRTVFSRIKRRALILVVAVVALVLTGCGAELTVYDYTENDVRYNTYELTFDRMTVDAMERTATGGYTVSSYFHELFTDFGYELVYATDADDGITLRYRKAVGANGSELDNAGQKAEFTTVYTENPFIRTYVSTAQNPFNGVRRTYDNIAPLRSSTMLERIKNGAVAHDEHGEIVVGQPSLEDAFPALRGADMDGLKLNYVRSGSKRMDSSGTVISRNGNNAEYMFSRYFDDTDTRLVFRYKRAVPYGWYLTAVAAGGVVLAVILIATRTKKQKPTLLDRFPYNPEEYRDYESHLPMSK